MKDEPKPMDWKHLPEDLGRRTRELWSASLGFAAAAEERGEELLRALRGDRSALVDEWQARSTRALDDLQKEANKAFDGLVHRGERLQEDSLRFVEQTAKDLSAGPRAVARDVEKAVDRAVGAALHRLDVPSRKDLERLADRVERLTREVTRLAARMEGVPNEAPHVFEVASEGDGWVVREAGTAAVLDRAGNKGEAVRLARERARASAPSELRILRLDGSVQDVNHYEPMT